MPPGYSICQSCKRPNYNTDYCSHCGEFISLEPLIVEEPTPIEVVEKKHSSLLDWLKKHKSHPNAFIRVFAQIAFSITVAVITIAAFIGSLIMALAG